ncbi:hypothetical protein EVAR_102422_1 [Eumeta japonica]|uniref:Uncharacterized protein n=1 Tax=Eumeta variegata TaxID=151549 RepID=A0A4C1YZW1_EUMVA|nr:hypothetical protein EVAR_102422_1 [Eumeta japonica]
MHPPPHPRPRRVAGRCRPRPEFGLSEVRLERLRDGAGKRRPLGRRAPGYVRGVAVIIGNRYGKFDAK